jgi:hypothetical protein
MASESEKLRKLAVWYREFAERAGNPMIWEKRLETAKKLEAEADRLSKLSSSPTGVNQGASNLRNGAGRRQAQRKDGASDGARKHSGQPSPW